MSDFESTILDTKLTTCGKVVRKNLLLLVETCS